MPVFLHMEHRIWLLVLALKDLIVEHVLLLTSIIIVIEDEQQEGGGIAENERTTMAAVADNTPSFGTATTTIYTSAFAALYNEEYHAVEWTENHPVVRAFVHFCGTLAPIAALIVCAAPYPTIRQINRDGTVGSLPLLPYTSLTTSAFVWMSYGMCKEEFKIWSANLIGLGLGVYFMYEYCKYIPRKTDVYATLPGSVQQHVQGTVAVIAMTTFLIVSTKDTDYGIHYLGRVAVVFSIALFSSPLAAIKTVVRTKSAKSIPLPFTMATVVNCFLWSVVGWLDMHDYHVIVPNMLGLSFGIIQLALKCIYGSGPPTRGSMLSTTKTLPSTPSQSSDELGSDLDDINDTVGEGIMFGDVEASSSSSPSKPTGSITTTELKPLSA